MKPLSLKLTFQKLDLSRPLVDALTKKTIFNHLLSYSIHLFNWVITIHVLSSTRGIRQYLTIQKASWPRPLLAVVSSTKRITVLGNNSNSNQRLKQHHLRLKYLMVSKSINQRIASHAVRRLSWHCKNRTTVEADIDSNSNPMLC